MRQAVMTAPYEVVVHSVPDPRRGPDQVLVSVGACGLCTWEQRVYRGVRSEYPLLGGHEVGAVVLEAPAGSTVAAGDVVAVSLLPRCGHCHYCVSGRSNLCAYNAPAPPPDGRPRGPGGLSELLVVAPADVYPIGPEGTCAQAALVEPLACVAHSVRRARCQPGDLLVVFGAGFTGLLHLAYARARGLTTAVVLTGRDAGVTQVPDADLTIASAEPAAILQALRDALGVPGADAAVVTRGGGAAVAAATETVRPGGFAIVFQSIPDGEPVPLDPARLRSREVMVGGAVSHTAPDFETAAHLVRYGGIDLAPLIGRTFPLAATREALDHAVARPGRRTLVLPSQR
ncbi:zinc-dependent alcohol dehydrogenase [Micromonospora sp. LH3U1]|uniref:zinc-dependent alcohol dehydrogenase n=1 Tax=Micromonospora sp. LH3U1 TaxID=3018339 RepID=UPI00234A6228|nr:alcohol dehydrogenase catalytic domain-containing protein [Micromonospora sp. LH3U1]WCN79442.1 alcohol dehydrogenase catalytic domain-containing protein [Micromonospora sp. LH3U1]